MMVERFNRTIRDKLNQYFTGYDTHKWIDVIQNLVKNYNNTVHSSIKKTPVEAKSQNFQDVDKLNKKIEIKNEND